MAEEANRCWCGSMFKDKPHNCIGTRGRVEGLLAEVGRLKDLVIARDKSLSEALNQRDTAELGLDALKKAHTDDLRWAMSRNAGLIVALHRCISEGGCGWSAQGEYDGCRKDSVFAPNPCAVCSARELLGKQRPPQKDIATLQAENDKLRWQLGECEPFARDRERVLLQNGKLLDIARLAMNAKYSHTQPETDCWTVLLDDALEKLSPEIQSQIADANRPKATESPLLCSVCKGPRSAAAWSGICAECQDKGLKA